MSENETIAMNEQKETAQPAAKNAEDAAALAKKITRSEKGVESYQRFGLRLLLLLAVLWVLFFKIIGLTRMPSADMYPRIDAGDMLLFYRLDRDVRAQDVVVIEKIPPDNTEKMLFVCRVVATAGDTVEISDGERLIINGNTMIEPNIFYPTPRYEGYTEYPITLGEGECFVLADSREGGADSRYFGAVSRDEIVGTVINVLRRNNL